MSIETLKKLLQGNLTAVKDNSAGFIDDIEAQNFDFGWCSALEWVLHELDDIKRES